MSIDVKFRTQDPIAVQLPLPVYLHPILGFIFSVNKKAFYTIGSKVKYIDNHTSSPFSCSEISLVKKNKVKNIRSSAFNKNDILNLQYKSIFYNKY